MKSVNENQKRRKESMRTKRDKLSYVKRTKREDTSIWELQVKKTFNENQNRRNQSMGTKILLNQYKLLIQRKRFCHFPQFILRKS